MDQQFGLLKNRKFAQCLDPAQKYPLYLKMAIENSSERSKKVIAATSFQSKTEKKF